MSRRLPLVAAISAAVLSAGATAVVSIAQNSSDASVGAPSAPAAASSAAGFAALERAQVATDRLPASVLAKFGAGNLTGPQVSESTSRKVARIARSDIFVAEGPQSFCTISVEAAGWTGGCTSKARASSGEPQVSFDLVESPDGNDHRVWGVVPRAVKSVSLEMKDGKRIPVPLVAGAFDLITDDVGAAFVWTDPNGIERSQAVLLPPSQ